MPTKRADTREVVEPPKPALTVPDMVVHQTGTITLTKAPADADVIFTVAPTTTGGASETTVHTDDNGAASVDYVPQAVGDVDVVVTQTVVSSLASASAHVAGSRAAAPLAATSLEPASSEAGPPQTFMLIINGAGFDINTRASFGVFSQEEADAGLGEAGEPKWEAGTRYINDGQVGIEISGGQFPGEDPAIPVSVRASDGTVAGPLTFAFTAPVQEEADG